MTYGDPHFVLDGHTLKLSFTLPGEPAVGYQVFDPESGTLLMDGARFTPDGNGKFQIAIAVPPEPGPYRFFISPVREGEAWAYALDRPFLLADVAVEENRVALIAWRITTIGALRRANLRRALGRALRYPFETIWTERSLIRTMVRRDILGRYRGSFAGIFWTLLNPLLLMLTYFFVFGVVLETRFGPDQSRTGFALYFLAGMLPWLAFSEAAGRSPWLMLEYRNFVKKLVFRLETLPVSLVISGLVTEALAIGLFVIALLITRGSVHASVIWLPMLLIPQILFTAGVCWFLAALGVFLRDLGQMMTFLLTLWFFVTPICYPESQVPHALAPVLSKNPVYVLVRGYRAIFLEGHAPAFGMLWKLWAVSFAVFIVGHAWFYKLRKSFADVI